MPNQFLIDAEQRALTDQEQRKRSHAEANERSIARSQHGAELQQQRMQQYRNVMSQLSAQLVDPPGTDRMQEMQQERAVLNADAVRAQQQLAPLVQSGAIEARQSQSIVASGVADQFQHRRKQRQASRELQTANNAFRNNLIDEGEHAKVRERLVQQYGLGVLADLPEFQMSEEDRVTHALNQQNAIRAVEEQYGAEGYVTWDREKGRPVLAREKMQFETWKSSKVEAEAKALQDDPRVQAQIMSQETSLKARMEAYKDALAELRKDTLDKRHDFGESTSSWRNWSGSVEEAEAENMGYQNAYRAGQQNITREFFPEQFQSSLPPELLRARAEAEGKKFYETPEAKNAAIRSGDLKSGDQYLDANGTSRTVQ